MKKLYLSAIIFFTLFFIVTTDAQNFEKFESIHKIFPLKKMSTHLNAIPPGTYTIGTSGDFPTIDSAFNSLSMDGVAGPVTFELTDDLYTAPSDGFGFFLNGPIPGADQNSRVTIEPAANMNVTVEGSGGAVFTFVNTSYLTMDGISVSGSQSLTVQSIRDTQYVHNQPISFFDNSDNNEVKNLNVTDGDNTYQAAPIGFFVTNPQSVPDSNLVQNNVINGGSIGAVIVGSGSTLKPTGNQITGNQIISQTESLRPWGFFLQYCSNTIIEKNVIQNLRINGENVTYGIQVVSSDSTVIRNNIIHDVFDSSGAAGAMGIIMVGGADNTIYNNMVYDIRGSAMGQYLTGILLHQEINPKIYYNSIFLSGNGAEPNGSSVLLIQSGCLNVQLMNNILVNTRDEGSGFSIGINDYTTSNLISDHNDIYSGTGNGYVAFIYDTDYSSLEDWQTTGQDLNSISEMPYFIDPDLHISTTDSTYIESGGTPLAGIMTDIDGDVRNNSTPDIGADEFTGIRLPVELIAFTCTLKNHKVVLNWSTATEINNRGFEIERSAGDQKFATIGFVKGNGTTTEQHAYTYTDKNLNKGKYSYRLKQCDYDGSFEYSDVVSVDFNIPLKFSLEQNYPNPFNPSTEIQFSLPKSGFTTLKVYDITGREVAVLVNEQKQAGTYSTEFNASKLASGVYFYRLTSGNFSAVKKLLLLK